MDWKVNVEAKLWSLKLYSASAMEKQGGVVGLPIKGGQTGTSAN